MDSLDEMRRCLEIEVDGIANIQRQYAVTLPGQFIRQNRKIADGVANVLQPGRSGNLASLSDGHGNAKRECRSQNSEVRSQNADAHLLMGYLRLRQAEDGSQKTEVRSQKLGEALASFRKASTLDARDPVALCMSGLVLEKWATPTRRLVTTRWP